MPVPARQRYAAPHEQVFVLALEARREGLAFEEFWERAVRPGKKLITTKTPHPPPEAVIWPDDHADRAIVIAATESAKENWRRAYERKPPTRGEQAFAALWAHLRGESSRGSKAGTGLSLSAA